MVLPTLPSILIGYSVLHCWLVCSKVGVTRRDETNGPGGEISECTATVQVEPDGVAVMAKSKAWEASLVMQIQRAENAWRCDVDVLWSLVHLSG
jgi:hypothetical protein